MRKFNSIFPSDYKRLFSVISAQIMHNYYNIILFTYINVGCCNDCRQWADVVHI